MRRTEKTLLEQMKISDHEISRRMKLLSINKDGLHTLANQKPIIEEHIDSIVNKFYEVQTSIEEISLLIGDADTLMRLRFAQRKYILDLFSGAYDAEYVNNRLRIGMVHKRIGVEPKLYLSAMATLREIITIVLKANISDQNELIVTLDTLDRILNFDTTLVFDTYIDSLVGEIEAAKNRAEEYAASLEIKVAERTRQLEEQARIDYLTKVYNHRYMQETLDREISIAKRRKSSLSIAYIDIDDFKHINDKQGHLKGDEILKAVGGILKSNTRGTDIPCRYGGDEFCVILPDCKTEAAKIICEKILNQFKEVYPDFSLSIGIAETDDETISGEQLIKNADNKMYEAKNKGKDTIRY